MCPVNTEFSRGWDALSGRLENINFLNVDLATDEISTRNGEKPTPATILEIGSKR
jgi:hypothetical protein